MLRCLESKSSHNKDLTLLLGCFGAALNGYLNLCFVLPPLPFKTSQLVFASLRIQLVVTFCRFLIFLMKTFPVFSTLLMDWVGGERRYHNGRRLSDPRCHRINFSCSEAISIRMVIMIGFQEGCAGTHFPFGAWKKVIFGRECILVGSR